MQTRSRRSRRAEVIAFAGIASPRPSRPRSRAAEPGCRREYLAEYSPITLVRLAAGVGRLERRAKDWRGGDPHHREGIWVRLRRLRLPKRPLYPERTVVLQTGEPAWRQAFRPRLGVQIHRRLPKRMGGTVMAVPRSAHNSRGEVSRGRRVAAGQWVDLRRRRAGRRVSRAIHESGAVAMRGRDTYAVPRRRPSCSELVLRPPRRPCMARAAADGLRYGHSAAGPHRRDAPAVAGLHQVDGTYLPGGASAPTRRAARDAL
jgi:hypothetical protein